MLNNEAKRTNQCTFWFIKIAASFILLLAVFFVMFTHKTFAVSMSPNPVRGVEVPIVVYDDLNSWISATPCVSTNKQPTSPKLVQWIALAGSPAITDFTVKYGQQSVDLGYHSAGVTCYNTRGLRTYYQIVGASSVPAGSSINPVGQNNVLDWWTNYTPGQYRHDATGFTFYPAGGFTVSTTYTITLKVKVYNEWNGTGIICAEPDAARAGLPYDRSSWSKCPTEDIPLSFRVTVDRQPNLNITTDCANQRFNITSSDQDGGPYKVAYGIDSKPLIILPNNFSATPLTVTIPAYY